MIVKEVYEIESGSWSESGSKVMVIARVTISFGFDFQFDKYEDKVCQ